MANDLNPYRGALTAAQVAEGMNAAANNGSRLLRDARVLMEAERWASACQLAILAIEEFGKIAILRRLATARRQELGGVWKEYRQHTAKNREWRILEIVGQGGHTLESMRPMFESDDHAKLLDNLKQIATYSDCLGDAHWSRPDDVTTPELAASIVHIASVLEPKRLTSTLEVELWIKHLGPPFSSMAEGKVRLLAWNKALTEHGLATSTAEEWSRFLFPDDDASAP